MPSPIFPNYDSEIKVRASWSKITDNQIIKSIKGNGLGVKLKSCKNRHFKIIGGKRTVDLYAITGTVVGEPRKGFGSVKYKGMTPERAIERVKSLALHGY